MGIDHLVDSNKYTDLLHLMNNECFTVLLSMQSNKGKRNGENINNNVTFSWRVLKRKKSERVFVVCYFSLLLIIL
jgi:pyridoxine/pyridoxamine 5'-phosphate oxidase